MLPRKVIAPCNSACIHKITHAHTWTLTLKGSTIKFTQSNRKFLLTGEIIGSKLIKCQNMLLTLCRQKVTKQGKMCEFSKTMTENIAFAIFTRYEKFSSRNWYLRLQLQFQQSFSHHVSCHDITSWNLSKTDIIKIRRPRAFKWGINCPNWTTRTTKS